MAKAAPDKRRLSELSVRKITPREKAFVVWDTHVRGLGLRVQPSGHRSWVCVYSFHNRVRWHHIGPADAVALASARKLAAGVLLRAATGVDVQAERKAMRSRGTFGELSAKYFHEYASRRNRSWRQTEALVRKNLLPRWGMLQAASITRSEVKTWFAAMTAPITANQTLFAAGAIFSFAVREGILPVNPCVGIEKNPTASRERVLSGSELSAFWKEFGKAGLPGVALKLTLLCGARPGEVAAMHYDHIADGFWEQPGAPQEATGWPGTKNGRSHRVALSTHAQALLAGVGGTGRVFDAPSFHAAMGRTMAAICKELGAPRVTAHDCRRSFATAVSSLGFGRQAVDRLLNHADNSVGSIYDRHSFAVEDRKIVEAVAQRIIGGVPTGNVLQMRR